MGPQATKDAVTERIFAHARTNWPDTEVLVRHSGACLSVYPSFEDGAAVVQWTCVGQESQQWTLEPTGNGTRLTNTVDLDASGLMRFAAPFGTSRLKAAVAKNLGRLKEILEST